jgi:hypothetical protein
MVRKLVVAALLTLAVIVGGKLPAQENSGDETGSPWRLEDRAGQSLVILHFGGCVAEYLYAFDASTSERRHETYKPYLQLFDPESGQAITKGPGGLFSHHRGIFIGWSKVSCDGKTFDFWGMSGGNQIQRGFSEKVAGPGGVLLRGVVDWQTLEGTSVLEEQREIRISAVPQPFYLAVDFISRLTAVGGDLKLDGDPEHAGVHYRAANEIAAAETVYYFPKAEADPRRDRDYPWVGMSYTLGQRRYSVVLLNHPDNPRETIFSAYRDYGRFGTFLACELPKGKTLELRYRFLIARGEMPGGDVVQDAWDKYAGVASASPPPSVTVLHARPLRGG